MFLSGIDQKNGTVTYNSFEIDPKKSFQNQIYFITEDLLQIDYHGTYTIDIGWAPIVILMEDLSLEL